MLKNNIQEFLNHYVKKDIQFLETIHLKYKNEIEEKGIKKLNDILINCIIESYEKGVMNLFNIKYGEDELL